MIDIVKASAGSGKTFLLAKTYISLLFKAAVDHPYRHILAVTFTNKATEEMKSRILKELDILARTPEESGYYKEFSKQFGSAAQIRKKAEDVLYDILHDYSAFSVSTIDKFFQTTLKSFAREIGQFSTYQIELDKDALVQESVDRMLDALTEDEKTLLEWLTESAMEQIEEGRKANVAESLYGIAKALKSDAHREVVEKNGIDEEKAYSKENLKAVRKVCRQCRKDFIEKVRNSAQAVLDVFSAAGVDPKETNRSFAAKLYTYAEDGLRSVDVPSPSFMTNALDPEKWFAKTKAKTLLPKVQGLLEEPFRAFVDLFGEEYKIFMTSAVLEKQVYSLGIASEFTRSFNDLMKEKNVLNIDDSNTLLRKIIDGTDTPFIYEKLGVRYTNFLLDEFQDTSTIQWDNFKPLVKESSDNGNENLIVGDVKQSIYRWRGSDWHLLDREIKGDFPSADDSKPLRANWRSLDQVVSFNNAFFTYAAGVLDAQSGEDAEVGRIYKDVAQEVRIGTPGEGMLDFTFCHTDCQLDVVLDSIRKIHDEGGAGYGQIAVLVRTNKDGATVASHLIAGGIPVISDDSLRVKSSLFVRRLASLLHYVDNPQDTVNGYLAMDLGVSCPESYQSIPDLAEELLRGLRRLNPSAMDSEVLYIQSFMDTIQEWVASNGNNLNAFLKYWDGLNPALSSPQDPDAVRIITVHKAKGLEFPYVIFPFAESVELSRPESHWCHPDLEGTVLETGVSSAYHVSLSSKSENTLFREDFKRERRLQIIDNFNTLYVALTRAGKGMHVIAKAPGKDIRNMSDILWRYIDEQPEGEFGRGSFHDSEGNETAVSFHRGEMPDFREKGGRTSRFEDRVASYPSFPLNPENDGSDGDVRERGRLKFSADAVDFFSAEESPRLKGLLLHDILSDVVVPSDLDEAVARRVRHGDISSSDAARYKALLEERIASVASKGWFPEDRSKVVNEVTLMDVDGSIHRPDRVLVSGKSVFIIDYKFGEEHEKYKWQIARYAKLYRAMGYDDVKACLWYVYENKFLYL